MGSGKFLWTTEKTQTQTGSVEYKGSKSTFKDQNITEEDYLA